MFVIDALSLTKTNSQFSLETYLYYNIELPMVMTTDDSDEGTMFRNVTRVINIDFDRKENVNCNITYILVEHFSIIFVSKGGKRILFLMVYHD